MNFVEELKWRGMIHDIMPGTEEQLQKEMTTAYVGIDPTADSLHIGHLVTVMMLKHLQVAGHRPIVLVGGATGMIGDPSGKSAERNFLDEKTLRHNQDCIKNQLSKFLDFNTCTNFYEISNIDLLENFIPKGERQDYGYVKRNRLTENKPTIEKVIKLIKSICEKYNIPQEVKDKVLISKLVSNKAIMVNNYDWMKEFSFLEFIRDIGKHITVNYMMAKDSVKKRISGEGNTGLSFTEFTYQLVQGTDFYHLYKEFGCKLQMGGSDQWGNITTGTELIRRKTQGEAFAMTCPLITKADGGKIGKTESGNIWLDPQRTSPYKFYQFWLNTSDADAEKYIKIFTLLTQKEVESLVKKHAEAPHARALQKRLAEEVTVMIHGREAYDASVEASQILFGKSTMDALKKIDEVTFLSVFEGVPTFNISKSELQGGIDVLELLSVKTQIFPSKGEARKTIKGGGVSLNKEKVTEIETTVNTNNLLNDKYLLFQKGKKNYFVLIAE